MEKGKDQKHIFIFNHSLPRGISYPLEKEFQKIMQKVWLAQKRKKKNFTTQEETDNLYRLPREKQRRCRRVRMLSRGSIGTINFSFRSILWSFTQLRDIMYPVCPPHPATQKQIASMSQGQIFASELFFCFFQSNYRNGSHFFFFVF